MRRAARRWQAHRMMSDITRMGNAARACLDIIFPIKGVEGDVI